MNLWTLLESFPAPPMTVGIYLGLSLAAIIIGALTLRGNPTRGA